MTRTDPIGPQLARRARFPAALVAALAACSPTQSPEAPPAYAGGSPAQGAATASAASPGSQGATANDATLRFEAVVNVPSEPDAPPRGKTFLGVLLKEDSGATWVIDYRADSPYRELRDQRVRVEGQRYEPPGQAIMMPHLRVSSLKLVNLSGMSTPTIIEIHGEERLTGRFEERTYPVGTKLEGERWLAFVDASGTEFHVSGREPRPDGALLGKTVTVTAHRIELSAFISRPGGPFLRVVRVDEP